MCVLIGRRMDDIAPTDISAYSPVLWNLSETMTLTTVDVPSHAEPRSKETPLLTGRLVDRQRSVGQKTEVKIDIAWESVRFSSSFPMYCTSEKGISRRSIGLNHKDCGSGPLECLITMQFEHQPWTYLSVAATNNHINSGTGVQLLSHET